jgi:uncharacterized protein YhhL (DUF1145 family)
MDFSIYAKHINVSLNGIDFIVLRAVSETPGVTANILGRKLSLSAYTVLVHAMKLVKFKLLIYKKAVLNWGETTSVYLFYPIVY